MILLIFFTQLALAKVNCEYFDIIKKEKQKISIELFDHQTFAKIQYVGPIPDRYFVAHQSGCLTQVASRESQGKRPILEKKNDSELCIEIRFPGEKYSLKLDGKILNLTCNQSSIDPKGDIKAPPLTN